MLQKRCEVVTSGETFDCWPHCKHNTTPKALFFDTPLSFHSIWSSPPCLGHKCTLSWGTIVVLCPAVLSGTTSSVVGYDTYEGLLMFFPSSSMNKCVFWFLMNIQYNNLPAVWYMNYIQINNYMIFHMQFRIIPTHKFTVWQVQLYQWFSTWTPGDSAAVARGQVERLWSSSTDLVN